MSIAELLPAGISPTPEQTEILLELAFLVTAVDGRLADEEIAAFGLIAARLRGKEALTEPETDELLERFASVLEWKEIEARVNALAPKLPRELHAVIYRLALGLAFVDHDPSEEEDRLHKALGDALALTPEIRAALARQVALDGSKARTSKKPDAP